MANDAPPGPDGSEATQARAMARLRRELGGVLPPGSSGAPGAPGTPGSSGSSGAPGMAGWLGGTQALGTAGAVTVVVGIGLVLGLSVVALWWWRTAGPTGAELARAPVATLGPGGGREGSGVSSPGAPTTTTTTDGPPVPGTTGRGDSRSTDRGPGDGAVVVHAAGAVSRPGVYTLPAGSRVQDLVAAAGGLTADADSDRVNLAAPVPDGSRVYVPRRGEVGPGPDVVPIGPGPGSVSGPDGSGVGPAGDPAPSSSSPLDLNQASAGELELLPGVGPATAAAIVAHRQQHGPFTSVDQLQNVRGIGPAKLAQIRDLVHV